ncbi:MAG: S-methyl-5-thioribose-1-phosphate isomerase [Vampirovibrio sp.]
MTNMPPALEMTSTACILLDQRELPNDVRFCSIKTAPEMARAITDMIVRGAPAIGIAAAYGVVLSIRNAIHDAGDEDLAIEYIQREIDVLRQSRPTAVNLMWALDRMGQVLNRVLSEEHKSLVDALPILEAEARCIHSEDIEANQAIGRHGASLLPLNARIHTHCNAGALATGGFGTALGVVREAFAQGRCSMVYADETRPRQQGSKLTAWELMQDGIPVTVVTDGMSGLMMKNKMVDAVITGADRIAANGDSANKIGTYNLALVAKAHDVPFYIAAPSATFDLSLADGHLIPIEERCGSEVTKTGETWTAPKGVQVFNPGFDVTPAALITGIITEKGVFYPPYHFTQDFDTTVRPQEQALKPSFST